MTLSAVSRGRSEHPFVFTCSLNVRSSGVGQTCGIKKEKGEVLLRAPVGGVEM